MKVNDQSNFKFSFGDKFKVFDVLATDIYVTLQNSRLFTHGIISSEGVSRVTFFI